jgi:hypothetical protein
VKVEHVGERMAALFPRLELVIHVFDPLGRQAANVVGDALHEVFGLGHDAAAPCSADEGKGPGAPLASDIARISRA